MDIANNTPEEYKHFEEEVKKRFPYANLKYHYKTPLWVVNLLMRKYQISNVAKCIQDFNENKRFQSPFDRDLEPYIDLEKYSPLERKQLESSWESVREYKVIDDSEEFKMNANENMTIHSFKRLLLTQVKKPFFFVKESHANEMKLKDSIFKCNDTIRITYDLDSWTTKIANFFNPQESFELRVSKSDDIDTIVDQIRDQNDNLGDVVHLVIAAKDKNGELDIENSHELDNTESLCYNEISRNSTLHFVDCKV